MDIVSISEILELAINVEKLIGEIKGIRSVFCSGDIEEMREKISELQNGVKELIKIGEILPAIIDTAYIWEELHMSSDKIYEISIPIQNQLNAIQDQSQREFILFSIFNTMLENISGLIKKRLFFRLDELSKRVKSIKKLKALQENINFLSVYLQNSESKLERAKESLTIGELSNFQNAMKELSKECVRALEHMNKELISKMHRMFM